MPERVSSAGIFDIALADYVLDPAPAPSLNSGTIHRLIEQSPLHAWMEHPRLNPKYQPDEDKRLDLGTVAHCLLLEDDDSKVVKLDFPDWRTNAAKAARDEARQAGKTPILAKDHAVVIEMVKVARKAIEESEIAKYWAEGESEKTLIWQEEGTWFRSRPDRHCDLKVLFDYKTLGGSAEPNAFLKHILAMGYDIQANLGIRGAYAMGEFDARFVIIGQEIEPPYAVTFASLDNSWLAWCDKKIDKAVKVWKQCLLEKKWPGYPSQICHLQPPAWAITQWEESK